MQQQVRIALVDGHRFFRSCIASAVARFANYRIIFEAGDLQEMADKMHANIDPHILLIDSNLLNSNGNGGACWLRQKYPQINIVLLSNDYRLETILPMMKAGIKGYLLKDAELEEIDYVLRKVSQNEVFYPDVVCRHLLQSNSVDFFAASLNNREIQFLKLAATERTYKEIAEVMCVSCRTVDGYRDHLFEKLHVKSRIGLVLYSIRNRIIQV